MFVQILILLFIPHEYLGYSRCNRIVGQIQDNKFVLKRPATHYKLHRPAATHYKLHIPAAIH